MRENETRLVVVEAVVVYTSNMLVDVLGNHGCVLDEKSRNALRTAIDELNNARTFVREIP